MFGGRSSRSQTSRDRSHTEVVSDGRCSGPAELFTNQSLSSLRRWVGCDGEPLGPGRFLPVMIGGPWSMLSFDRSTTWLTGSLSMALHTCCWSETINLG